MTVAGSANYIYDANGNMTVRANQTLAWNVENQLSSVTQTGQPTESYVYDGDGVRVKKTTCTTFTAYANRYYYCDD